VPTCHSLVGERDSGLLVLLVMEFEYSLDSLTTIFRGEMLIWSYVGGSVGRGWSSPSIEILA
jgi:hypothetical protein